MPSVHIQLDTGRVRSEGMDQATVAERLELENGLFDAAAVAAAICSSEGRILHANESLLDLMGADRLPHESTLDQLLGADDVLRRLLDAGNRSGLQVEIGAGAIGALVRAHARPFLVGGHDHYLVQFEDRRDVAAHIRTLELLAYEDDLTGLLNRRGFEAEAERLLAIARRHHRSLAVLFVDVDGLKAINDEHGHHAGDLAIAEAGHLLNSVFRTADAIGRYGGDEFCVLALTNGPQSAEHLETRLEIAVGEHVMDDARFTLNVTVGAVHINDPNGVTVTEIIARADRAMYAKRRATA